jgi:hypothetical protein
MAELHTALQLTGVDICRGQTSRHLRHNQGAAASASERQAGLFSTVFAPLLTWIVEYKAIRNPRPSPPIALSWSWMSVDGLVEHNLPACLDYIPQIELLEWSVIYTYIYIYKYQLANVQTPIGPLEGAFSNFAGNSKRALSSSP